MENTEGRNLEEINKKKILNFGNLSRSQSAEGINVKRSEAWIKCRRCNKLTIAKWNNEWDIGNWKVYLYKTQVEKAKASIYQIVGNIEFYCPDCDRRYNYLER